MTWVKIDDKAPSHPKLIAAGAEASWLWLCGLCYCNSYQTDGVIPQGALRALNPGAGWDLRKLKKLAEKLVNVGLWEHCDDTPTTSERPYNVKNYAEYQQAATKLATEERRSANKSRASDWRERQRFSQKEPPSQRYASAEQPTANASPVPARPDQYQIREEREERDARAPLDSRSSAEQVRGLLIRGYSQRYEKHANDAWVVGSNDPHIRQVTAYVLAAEGEPQAIVDELLDGYFRDEKRRAARWPWRWLAEDPGRHRPDQAAAKAAAERKRFWDEHAAREVARQAEQAKQPQEPSKEMSEAEIEKMASDLMARLSTSMAMPANPTKRKPQEAAE